MNFYDNCKNDVASEVKQEVVKETKTVIIEKISDLPKHFIDDVTSVYIPIEGTNENSLRTYVCALSNRENKRYRCLKDKNSGFFEIYLSVDKSTAKMKPIEIKIGPKSPRASEDFKTLVFEKQNFRFEKIPHGKSMTIDFKYIVDFKNLYEKIKKFNSESEDTFLIYVQHEDLGLCEIAAFNRNFWADLYDASPKAKEQIAPIQP